MLKGWSRGTWGEASFSPAPRQVRSSLRRKDTYETRLSLSNSVATDKPLIQHNMIIIDLRKVGECGCGATRATGPVTGSPCFKMDNTVILPYPASHMKRKHQEWEYKTHDCLFLYIHLRFGGKLCSCLINFYTHLYMFVVLKLQTDPLGVFKSHVCVILSYTVWAAHESSSVFCLKTQKIKNVALLQGNSHPCWMCMQTLWTVWTSTLSCVTLSPQPLSIKATFVVIQVEPTPSPK